MTFATGKQRNNRGFTLIELILVMAIMIIVMGIVAPEMGNFFRGRNLDNEAERFLTLTRYGRSRAISEGAPVELWIDAKEGAYGLQAMSGYTETRTNAVSYSVASSVQISASTPSGLLVRSNYWTPSQTRTRTLPSIRFQPDGYISDSSPHDIYLKQGDDSEVWIAENDNHLRYDIQPGPPPQGR